jgi:hypothetical protein
MPIRELSQMEKEKKLLKDLRSKDWLLPIDLEERESMPKLKKKTEKTMTY